MNKTINIGDLLFYREIVYYYVLNCYNVVSFECLVIEASSGDQYKTIVHLSTDFIKELVFNGKSESIDCILIKHD